MIDLIITACLLTAPDRCQRVTLSAPGTPQSCIMAAPQTVAGWQTQHPKWRPVRVACIPSGDDA